MKKIDRVLLEECYNILSVDWDYFFEDVEQFDWQCNEDLSVYYEVIWPLRYSNHRLFSPDRKIAYEVMRPREEFRTFWGKMDELFELNEYTKLIITESHLDLYKVLFNDAVPYLTLNIFNFDQHHDAGYGEKIGEEINCGNWAGKLHKKEWIDNYCVLYPEWRRGKPENYIPDFVQVGYGVEDLKQAIGKCKPQIDAVFICRSGPWTPSWSDGEWLEFVKWWDRKDLYKRNVMKLEYAMKERPFDREEAERIKEQTDQLRSGRTENG